ncbi:MAG: ABC transporter permease, partial [Cellulomonas sp.]
MTTLTPTRPARPAVDPQALARAASNRVTLGATVRQSFSMGWRGLLKVRRTPEQLFDVTLQPILFTLMFTYIFGGAIAGDVQSYLPFFIPGILVQTVITTSVVTGVQLREDMDKGVFDRFRVLPIARIAPLAGPMVADMLRYLIASTLTFATGIFLGYRPGGGVPGVAAAILLGVIAGWSLAWIFTWFGTVGRSAQGVQA